MALLVLAQLPEGVQARAGQADQDGTCERIAHVVLVSSMGGTDIAQHYDAPELDSFKLA